MTVQTQGRMKKGKGKPVAAKGKAPKRKVASGAGGGATPGLPTKAFPLGLLAAPQKNKSWSFGLKAPVVQRLLIKARKTGLMNYTAWCPECKKPLSPGMIREGFSEDPCDISTECPDCGMRFDLIFSVGNEDYDGDHLCFPWLGRRQTFAAWRAFLSAYEAVIGGDPACIIEPLMQQFPALVWNIMENAPSAAETLPDAIHAMCHHKWGIALKIERKFVGDSNSIQRLWEANAMTDWTHVPLDLMTDLTAIMGLHVFEGSTLAQIVTAAAAMPRCGPVPPSRMFRAAGDDGNGTPATKDAPPPQKKVKKKKEPISSHDSDSSSD